MNYKRIHDQIIDRAKSRTLPKDTYTERHHIVPRCLGGNNSKDNLVQLTAREHYIIHWLLYKIHKTPKLAYAWHMMGIESPTTKRYNSYTFEYARKISSTYSSILFSGSGNPMYNKTHSSEVKKKLSESKLGKPSWNKGIKCPTNKSSWNKGIPCSEEVKIKISLKTTGAKRSIETKKKQSIAAIGKPKSIMTKQKMSEIARNRIPIECIHCGMISIVKTTMTRFHNDNCKYK